MIALKENIHPQKRKFNRIFNKIMLFCKDFSIFYQNSMELWFFWWLSLTNCRSGSIVICAGKGE